MAKWVYDFSEGSREMRELLGGKGANVAEMTRVLGPAWYRPVSRSRRGLVEYMRLGTRIPKGLASRSPGVGRLERNAGKLLGEARSVAGVGALWGGESMPGMLDTVLNLGLNDESVLGLARVTGNDRFAWDSYRRFVQMLGNVSRGIPGERFEDAIARRRRRGV